MRVPIKRHSQFEISLKGWTLNSVEDFVDNNTLHRKRVLRRIALQAATEAIRIAAAEYEASCWFSENDEDCKLTIMLPLSDEVSGPEWQVDLEKEIEQEIDARRIFKSREINGPDRAHLERLRAHFKKLSDKITEALEAK